MVADTLSGPCSSSAKCFYVQNTQYGELASAWLGDQS